MEIRSDRFRENARRALADADLHTALDRTTAALTHKREAALAELDDLEALRDRCAAVKAHTLDHLDRYLGQLTDAVEARGGTVHFASDAAEANRIVVDIARARGVHTAVKGKSMVSEEIGLNVALESAGVTPIETDLGEYILQLDDDVPSHLIAPVIHKTREHITALFHDRLGTPATAGVEELTAAARAELRRRFLSAEMGITGVNFAVADSGTLVLVENEGNLRLTSSVPRIHLALMGMEKVIPRLADLEAFLTLLPRSATGQRASSYVSMVHGPRLAADADGPEELHLVILDNGRSTVLADERLRDTLRCIRCGACLNVCPVYTQVGGHAYGWVYPGPIGAVLDPGLLGMEATASLPMASSLCGACGDVCPVKIPIPELLIEHRRRAVTLGQAGPGERAGMAVYGWLAGQPWAWEAGAAMARLASRAMVRGDTLEAGWLPLLSAWLQERDFPAPPTRSFRHYWRHGLEDEA